MKYKFEPYGLFIRDVEDEPFMLDEKSHFREQIEIKIDDFIN